MNRAWLFFIAMLKCVGCGDGAQGDGMQPNPGSGADASLEEATMPSSVSDNTDSENAGENMATESKCLSVPDLVPLLPQQTVEKDAGPDSACASALVHPLLRSFAEEGDRVAGAVLLRWACLADGIAEGERLPFARALGAKCKEGQYSDLWFSYHALSHVNADARAEWRSCFSKRNSGLRCEPTEGDSGTVRLEYEWSPPSSDTRPLSLVWSLENARESSGTGLPSVAYTGTDVVYFELLNNEKEASVALKASYEEDGDAGVDLGSQVGCEVLISAPPAPVEVIACEE